MTVAAIVVGSDAIHYKCGDVRETIERTSLNDLPMQLAELVRKLPDEGVHTLRALNNGHSDLISEMLKTSAKLINFESPTVVKVAANIARLGPRLGERGRYGENRLATKSKFGLLWLDRRPDGIDFQVCEVQRNERDRDEINTLDGIAGPADYAGYSLEMAERATDRGLDDLAIFVPELSELWNILLAQIGQRLRVNIVPFAIPDMTDAVIAYPLTA
jgi:hypothetical protein